MYTIQTQPSFDVQLYLRYDHVLYCRLLRDFCAARPQHRTGAAHDIHKFIAQVHGQGSGFLGS